MSHTRTHFRAAVGATLIAATMISTGCAAPTTSGSDESVLRWAASLPAHWDPVVQGSGFGFNLTALAYASLTEIDEDGNAAPGLAESWDYSDNGKAVTFHLREGLTFQDDTPLDAEAVKDYIERAKTQENSALFGDLTSIESVTADSDTDVTVHLTQVDYQIPLLLGKRTAQITSPTAAEDPEKLDQWPVGAGPFTVVEFVPESHVYLEKNPDYWDAEDIHIDRVELEAAPDPSTLVSAIQTGVYDFAYGLDPSQVAAAENAGLNVATHPSTTQRSSKPCATRSTVRNSSTRRRLGSGTRRRSPFPRDTSPTTPSRPIAGPTTRTRRSRSSPMPVTHPGRSRSS
jgi:peptide/nickel transport system substrate-binding protein